jgi:hypothetical protein
MPKVEELSMQVIDFAALASRRDLPELATHAAAADTAHRLASAAEERARQARAAYGRVVSAMGSADQDEPFVASALSAAESAEAEAQALRHEATARSAELAHAAQVAWAIRLPELQAQLAPRLDRMIEELQAALAVARLVGSADIGHAMLRKFWQDQLSYLDRLKAQLLAAK